MNNKKLIQIIKKNKIEQLENELNELTELKKEYERQIDVLDYVIKEYLKIKEQILSEVKKIKKEFGDSKKIKKDLEMVNQHLISIIREMNKDRYFECTLEEYKQALEHKSKEFEEQERNERENVIKRKEKVRIEINKISKKMMVTTGGRKLDTSLEGIRGAIVSRKIIEETVPDVNFDIIEEYYKELKEYQVKKSMARNAREELDWIKKSETWLPKMLNINTLQNCQSELQQKLDFIEESKGQIGTIDKRVREKKKSKQLEIEKLKRFEQKYREKKKRIEEEKHKVNEIQSLDELQITREEALNDLDQEETSYMVIPIPENIMTKSELFNYLKKISIKTDDTEIDTVYKSDTLTGAINSNYCIDGEKRALLVKLSEIDLENIARINNDGTMVLTEFEIPDSSILITHNEQEEISREFKVLPYDTRTATLQEKVKEFLQDDFTDDPNEYRSYGMFKNFHKKTYTEGEKERIVEIIRAMHSNYFIIEGKEIILDGKREILSDLIKNVLGGIEDIKNVIASSAANKSSGESGRIEEIAFEIDRYIEEPKRNIEIIYKQLLHQYLKDNPKARAFYNDEGNTKVKINGRIISMKPKLPQDDDELEKRLFRKEEDKIYKEMKTAALCNKLAHLYDSQIKKEELRKKPQKSKINMLKRKRNLMYSEKNKLIKRVIKKAKNRSDISIGKIYDTRGLGIAMDIPGYKTIELHVGDNNSSIIGNDLKAYTYIDGKTRLQTKENDTDNYIRTGIMIRRGK